MTGTENVREQLMEEILEGKGLSVAKLARLVPEHRPGKPTHPSLITRWICDGVAAPGGGRVRLEAVRLSGRWVTSAGALRRFLLAQQQPHEEALATPPPKRRGRERQVARAMEELRQLGV